MSGNFMSVIVSAPPLLTDPHPHRHLSHFRAIPDAPSLGVVSTSANIARAQPGNAAIHQLRMRGGVTSMSPRYVYDRNDP